MFAITDILLQLYNRQLNYTDDTTVSQLHRDLRKTKALLKDAQTVLQHQRDSAPSRGLLKQLRNQLEDAELARAAAVKARQRDQTELDDVRVQLEQATVAKAHAEERLMALMKEKNSLQGAYDEQADELQALLKKYKAQVQQGSIDLITINDYIEKEGALQRDLAKVKDQVR